MPKKSASQKRLEAVRHPLLVALKKIGPIFPPREDLEGLARGMRGVERKGSASPFNFKYRQKRRERKQAASASTARNR